MISITDKTLKDLEFHTVLEAVSASCTTEPGMEKALQIVPFKNKETLMQALGQTSEYVSSFENNNALPNHGFEPISNEVKFLAIEDSYLEAPAFRKIANISETVNTLIKFLEKIQ